MKKTKEEVLHKYPFLQPAEGYRYSIDALMLAGFVNTDKNRQKILDIGTGSGIITLLLSKRFPDFEFSAVEIQKDLYELALENFKLHSLEVNATCCDYQDIKGQDIYDIIVSNPPYYNKGNQPKKEQVAIARHEIIGDMESLVKKSNKLLKGGGFLYVIYPAERLAELMSCLGRNNLAPVAVKPVYPKEDTEGTLILVAARKSHRGKMRLLAPLYIGDSEGEDTDEIKELYEKGVLKW